MLTRASLNNPYALFAICMIVLVLGGVSYQRMRVDIFPEIKIPTILVTTFYRGLSPSEMEGAITLKMEQRFVEASYVEHFESQSLAGMSYIRWAGKSGRSPCSWIRNGCSRAHTTGPVSYDL